ncbi:Smr/MutS family protein [Pseudaquidulcibacter saccharophilus]|uniref:Smr/MutS family protein n=1 Tax=Pseudaquidulcibacter saccharophilus TaxID=2831900 RepID=UPI001EFF2EA1|nr:Smr/MutS family protein [Pseudaquidulcibacter saccharophilus]
MRPLKPEEAKLWHKVGKTTKGLKGKAHHKLIELEAKIPTEPQFKEEPTKKKAITTITTKKVVTKKISAPVADIGNEKRIRRGRLEIDATIDLHGMTQLVAQERLRGFILMALSQNYRNILVITGKGVEIAHHKHEPFDMFAPSQRGVLRQKLRDWLNTPDLRPFISGVSEANQKHGGSGAFYVRLKQKISK